MTLTLYHEGTVITVFWLLNALELLSSISPRTLETEPEEKLALYTSITFAGSRMFLTFFGPFMQARFLNTLHRSFTRFNRSLITYILNIV
jgi:hypothetical protein